MVDAIRPESSSSETVRGGAMIRVALRLLAALCLLVVGACAGGGDNVVGTPASPAVQAAYPGTDEGARALVEKIGAVGATALLASLRPTTADYQALFQPDFAAQAERFYKKRMWASDQPAEPLAKPGQTEVRMWKSTTEELRAWTPTARANFPGGYEQIKDHLKPGLAIYTWDYTEPGEEYGMAYNGLVFVNEHWALFPKPWYALEERE